MSHDEVLDPAKCNFPPSVVQQTIRKAGNKTTPPESEVFQHGEKVFQPFTPQYITGQTPSTGPINQGIYSVIHLPGCDTVLDPKTGKPVSSNCKMFGVNIPLPCWAVYVAGILALLVLIKHRADVALYCEHSVAEGRGLMSQKGIYDYGTGSATVLSTSSQKRSCDVPVFCVVFVFCSRNGIRTYATHLRPTYRFLHYISNNLFHRVISGLSPADTTFGPTYS
jgi:hypothetical protein